MRHPLLFKCLILAAVGLVLAVPLVMIADTVAERAGYRAQAVREIAANTAGPQTLAGPLLVIPVVEEYDEIVPAREADRPPAFVRARRERALTLMPRQLALRGSLQAQRRAYGIHSAAVYELHAHLSGSFDARPDAELPGLGRNAVLTWGRPRLVVGVGDARGLVSEPQIRVGGAVLAPARGTAPSSIGPGFEAELPGMGRPTAALPFELDFVLLGTESFAMVPLADATLAELDSNWPDPSFGGGFLPREQRVDAAGFQARWSVSALASGAAPADSGAAGAPGAGPGARANAPNFNVRLIDAVDVYRLALRAVKYAPLFIVALFASFLSIELIAALPIHPVQYLFVGLAQALFFLLLLSLSERIAFGWAYLAASVACIGLISAYLAAVLRGAKRAAAVGGALALLFAALYGVLQSEQNALLLGSLLLFALLAALMLGTRRVDWYRIGLPVPQAERAGARP